MPARDQDTPEGSARSGLVRLMLGRFAVVLPSPAVADADGGTAPASSPAPLPPRLGDRFGHQPQLHQILATKVLHGHVQNRNQLLEAPTSDFGAVDAAEAELLVLGMAAAAHADGSFDARERARTLAALQGTCLDAERRRVLEREIEEPPCLETLLRTISRPQTAARFYAASLAVIDKSSAVGRTYARYLAQRLALPADLAVRLDRRFGF